MNRNFKFKAADKPDPVYFEQIFAEKPGGGILANPEFDVLKSTAVGKNAEGKIVPIKAYRLVEAADADATSIKIAKGSGVKEGDILATGRIGVACTKVDTETSEDYDVVTVTLGVAIDAGKVLYQSKVASVDVDPDKGIEEAVDAEPFVKPLYILGTFVPANEGDFEVRLINGANLRKETANVADEVVALMKSIDLV